MLARDEQSSLFDSTSVPKKLGKIKTRVSDKKLGIFATRPSRNKLTCLFLASVFSRVQYLRFKPVKVAEHSPEAYICNMKKIFSFIAIKSKNKDGHQSHLSK